MREKVDMTHDPEWCNDWWVNPVVDGSSEADPVELSRCEEYIAQNYTPETVEKIKINLREVREE